jgi:hypothetical protein
VNARRPLSAITDADWVRYRWIEVTTPGHHERHFIQGGERTPDEAAKVVADLETLSAAGLPRNLILDDCRMSAVDILA